MRTMAHTLTAHGSGRLIQVPRRHLRVVRPKSSVPAPRRTSNLHASLQTFPFLRGHPSCFREQPFGLGSARSSRLWIPAVFRLLAFAAQALPSPRRICAAGAVGLLACARPHGGYHVPLPQATTDVGARSSAVDRWWSRTADATCSSLSVQGQSDPRDHRSTVRRRTLSRSDGYR
jgi:hypothetical protein